MHPPRELLENCRYDNRKAHHELYVMCFPVLYSVCTLYHVNRDDRLSALNMIFLKVIRGLGHYLKRDETVPFEAWIRKVAIRCIIDEFRREKNYREHITLSDEVKGAEEPYHHQLEEKYDKEQITEAIDALPPASRTVFNLFVIDGYRHEEIAGLLGISIGTSKAHLFKARKKLQELLSKVEKVKKAINR